MKNKIFESKIGVGFKYYYPFLLTGLLSIIWISNLMVFQSGNKIFNNIWRIALLLFIVDGIIIYFFQKKKTLKVFKQERNFTIEINQGTMTKSYNNYKYLRCWWSYNNLEPIEPQNIYGDDEIEMPSTSKQKMSGTGPSIPKTLFIEFESKNDKKLYLSENLEEYENLPTNWAYQLMDKGIFDQSIESYKLKKLQELIK